MTGPFSKFFAQPNPAGSAPLMPSTTTKSCNNFTRLCHGNKDGVWPYCLPFTAPEPIRSRPLPYLPHHHGAKTYFNRRLGQHRVCYGGNEKALSTGTASASNDLNTMTTDVLPKNPLMAATATLPEDSTVTSPDAKAEEEEVVVD